MPDLLNRYQLDKTGINPDNLVIGEIHTLRPAQNRIAVPRYGAYYTESISVYDNLTNQRLVKNSQFLCVELVQEASLKYGKEICLILIITDPMVSNEIRIDYQVLGGNYVTSAQNLENIYQAYLTDQRPVDWLNIINKPTQFTPAVHNHLLQDLYGWENIVDGLDRISRSLRISNLPEYQALVNWVESRLNIITREELEQETGGSKLVTYEQLRDIIGWNTRDSSSITFTVHTREINEGLRLYCQINTVNIPDGFIFFYTVENNTTSYNDFQNPTGSVFITNSKANFELIITKDQLEELDEEFSLSIRKYSTTGIVVANSGPVMILDDQYFDLMNHPMTSRYSLEPNKLSQALCNKCYLVTEFSDAPIGDVIVGTPVELPYDTTLHSMLSRNPDTANEMHVALCNKCYLVSEFAQTDSSEVIVGEPETSVYDTTTHPMLSKYPNMPDEMSTALCTKC